MAASIANRSRLPSTLSPGLLTPDLTRHLDHPFELAPLIVRAEQITNHIGGKAALRRYGELIQREGFGRLIDTSLKRGGRFQFSTDRQ